MNVRKKENIKNRLEELIAISGGRNVMVSGGSSVEDLLQILKVYIVYNRFDLWATKTERDNAE